MNVIGFDVYWDEKFANEHNVKRAASLDEIYAASDYISLHTNLTPETRDMINAEVVCEDEEGRFDFELRARRNREHRRHGGRAEIRAGGRLRHGRFGSGAAGGGSSAAQAAERRLHAARRVAHLRERGAAGHLRREKPHPRDERRKTHRAGESRSAGEENFIIERFIEK